MKGSISQSNKERSGIDCRQNGEDKTKLERQGCDWLDMSRGRRADTLDKGAED